MSPLACLTHLLCTHSPFTRVITFFVVGARAHRSQAARAKADAKATADVTAAQKAELEVFKAVAPDRRRKFTRQHTTMANFVNRKISEHATNVLDRMWYDVLINHTSLPLSMAQWEDFRIFVTTLNPGYHLPGRDKTRKGLATIERLHDEDLRRELAEARKATLGLPFLSALHDM